MRKISRRGLLAGAGSSLLLPRRGSGQLMTSKSIGQLQSEHVARKIGLMFVLDIATFIGSENAPGTTDPALFNPTAINIDQWVSAAQAAKAKYAIPISVHSCGLAYWPTATTTFNLTNCQPWYSTSGVDIVGVFCDKFRMAGITVIPYWSIWQSNFLFTSPTQTQYRQYLEAQLIELFTNYGPFPAIWCDGGLWHFGSYYPWTNPWDMKAFIHKYCQSDCLVINNTHVRNPADTDLIEYEGGVIPVGNTIPSEGIKSQLNDGNWFWKPAGQPQALRSAATHLASYNLCVGNASAYCIAPANDTTGNVPSDQFAILQSFGGLIP